MKSNNPRVKEALLQQRINDKVKCLTCERHCQIAEGEFGFCRTRKNIKGRLYTLVSNGYMTAQVLKILIEKGLDAMNIDIKGDKEAVSRYCQADVEKVWRNAKLAKENNVWLELTTLVIPGVNDDEPCLKGIARRIRDELGEDTPWHVTGYYPSYKFASELYVPPTPVRALKRAREIGKEEGLNYVYLGNVPGHPGENTYCPSCSELLIERYGFGVSKYRLSSDKKCPNCQREIPIVGEFLKNGVKRTL